MSVDWGDYEQFDPGVFGPLQQLPRREARAGFNRLMAAKDVRIEALRALLKRNHVELGSSDPSLQDLNDWFRQEVEADPDRPGRMARPWYGVVTDLALFLGDVMIERAPGLRWEFFTGGKKDAAYQRAVIMGFTQVANPKYNIDPGRLLATYGHRIVSDQEVEEQAFWQWVRAVELKA